MKISTFTTRIFSAICIISIISSCNQYRLVSQTKSFKSSSNYESLTVPHTDEVLILHTSSGSWELTNVKEVDGRLHAKLIPTTTKQDSLYNMLAAGLLIPEKFNGVKEQMHLYVDNVHNEGNGYISFHPDDVKEVVAVQNSGDGWRIVKNVLLVIAGLIVGMAVFLLIVCNCPHAYTYNGDKLEFTNTLFTGAIAKNLERSDYKLLPEIDSDQNYFDLTIRNEENESQFINQLELIVVNHDKNIEVLADQKGDLYSITSKNKPIDVFDQNGKSLTSLLSEMDELAYDFNELEGDGLVSTFAKFKVPDNLNDAKLILSLKNTNWGALVAESFGEMMGDRYGDWVENNRKRSPEEALMDMKKAGIPFVVSIKKDEKWVEIDNINLVGEVVYNSIVVPIDRSYLNGSEIEVRLQSGFKFWELDYLAMDFSKQLELDYKLIQASNLNDDNIEQLLANDNEYLSLMNNGDSINVRFNNLPVGGEKRTFILRSKGYYLSHEEFSGRPYWKEILRVNKPAGLSILSRDVYLELLDYYGLSIK